ncbi:GPN-loop GTPase 2-like [Oppia nitens]|uniref:GPN-loop GTPase 2-like n=1 Tax=Oppia nitens TaxID=1686743 RepID=UPI0023DA06A8|nr:GPN-loop GTPase 2-like [Oppia nitens]
MNNINPVFGQLVIGPAGSGKTTYCDVMAKYLRQLGRSVILINIDPANDVLPYEATIDISKLITLSDVMETMSLGPNGGLLYCIDYLNSNFDWLRDGLQKAIDAIESGDKDSSGKPSIPYILVDSPGQIELYTNHSSLKNVLTKLNSLSKQLTINSSDVATNGGSASSDHQKIIDLRLVCVNIVDSHYCNDPSKFISVALNCLNTMIHLEMPHINVLSKVDIIQKYAKSDFGLDFYCEVLDLNYLVDKISDDPFLAKFKKLTKGLAGIIEDYSLISFIPLDVNNAKTVLNVLKGCDRANGFYLSDLDEEQLIQKYFRDSGSANFESSKYDELLDNLHE